MECVQNRYPRKFHSIVTIICTMTMILLSTAARAQSPSSPATADSQEQRLKSLEDRLQNLEEQIGFLKQELQVAPASASSPGTGEPRLILTSAVTPAPTAPAPPSPQPQAPAVGQA